MNFIKIDFSKVKGYNNLSDKDKKIFRDTYEIHNSIHGLDYKEEWIPEFVEPYGETLKVVFRNGKWLHYTKNNEWY